MTARSTVFDLARQLLQLGDGSVLDASLEQLAATATDPLVRECLLDLVQARLADTLREALEDDRLDRFAAESCTEREEQALCRALSRLLGKSGIGDDDPARLAEVDEPPPDEAGLRAWAERHGVTEILDRLARSPRRGDAGAAGRTPDAWPAEGAAADRGGRNARGSGLLSARDAAEEARVKLLHAARSRRAIAARKALWQRPAPQGLTRMVERLRAMLVDIDAAALAAFVFLPARPVSLDPASGVVEGTLVAGHHASISVRLFLSGNEHRGLVGACEACGEGGCRHVQALAGRLMDAALERQDRLHSALAQVAAEPSWRRFITALKPLSETAGTDREHGQLSFRLREKGRRLSVSVFLHKPLHGGGYSAGRKLPIARAARSRAANSRDRLVLEAIALGSRPLSTTAIPVDPLILRALVDHPRVRLDGLSAPLTVAETSVQVTLEEQGDGLLPRVSLAGAPLPSDPPNDDVQYVYRHEQSQGTLIFASLAPPVRRLLGALADFRGVLPPESFEALAPWLSELRQVALVEAPSALSGLEVPVAQKLLMRISEGPGEAIVVALSARPLPLGALWPPGEGPDVVHGLQGERRVHARRDLTWERLTARQVLEALDMRAHIGLEPFVYRIEGTEAALSMLAAVARLADLVELEWSERARRLTLAPTIRAADLNVRLFKKGHWLAVEGGALSGDALVAVGRLLQAARRGERFVPIGGDSYAEIEGALRTQLEASQLCAVDLEREPRIAAAAAPTWLSHLGERCAPGDEDTEAWLRRAATMPDPATCALPTLPPELRAALRGYQQQGVAWLAHMSRWAPGACLADEMGLGKTVQAIALLELRAELGPALVIAPTSVTVNWELEIARFGRSLRPRAYRGPRRGELPGQAGAGDVIITSYDLLLRDADVFAETRFATQVVDEAQWIKNARTRRARAVMRVQAGFRVALSGTPVENRLGDLWSLCALVAPGLLGSWSRFRALFAVPIERYQDSERSQHLRALVAPFVLRRTKREVASELPSRTEVIHRIELSGPERQLYQAASEQARQGLQKRAQREATMTTHVLSELTRLRQLACHPRLVLEQPNVESSKLAALHRLLADILPRGHRALLFSQFVQHLSLVREGLDHRGTPYLYLDGATPVGQRQRLVERFQAGEAPLFLISLKAGGAGLNLTAADYVIHLDPWWNPAAEDQASDRAHRLGQQRPVTIVKLVAIDTIEERVLALHGHKRELADSLFSDRATPAPLDLTALEALF